MSLEFWGVLTSVLTVLAVVAEPLECPWSQPEREERGAASEAVAATRQTPLDSRRDLQISLWPLESRCERYGEHNVSAMVSIM